MREDDLDEDLANEKNKEELIATSIFALWLYQSSPRQHPTSQEITWLSGLFRLGEAWTRRWFESRLLQNNTSEPILASQDIVIPDKFRRNLKKCLVRTRLKAAPRMLKTAPAIQRPHMYAQRAVGKRSRRRVTG